MLKYQTDNISEKGFINKKYILTLMSQEEIFSLVFGFLPNEYDKVKSPFREDKTAGCYFTYSPKGDLRFVDFANTNIYRGIRMSNIDCFDAVMIYYNLNNFFKTLEFIIYKYKNQDYTIQRKLVEFNIHKREKIETKILFNPRDFNVNDKNYWSRYGISKNQLIKDNIIPVNRFYINTTNKVYIEKNICYSLGRFENNHVKLYKPLERKNKKFITNCVSDDVGNITSINPKGGKLLIISKSYKDCRLLRNLNFQCVWLQSEVIKPNDDILYNLCNKFDKCIIFFDNDETGVNNSKYLSDYINNKIFNGYDKCSFLYLPIELLKYNITDPADLYYHKGRKEFESLIINLIKNK